MGKTVIELVLPAVSLITFAMQSNSFLPQGPSQGFTVIRKSLNPHAAVEILNDATQVIPQTKRDSRIHSNSVGVKF